MTDTNDHDLIIRIDTRLTDLITTVKDIKDGTVVQLADHEKRIQDLEKTRIDFRGIIKSNKTLMIIMISIGVCAISLLVWHLTGYKI